VFIIIWRYFLVFSCWTRPGWISFVLSLWSLVCSRLYQLLCWNRFTKWSFWFIFLSWLLRFLEQLLYFIGVLSHCRADHSFKQGVLWNIKEWLRFIIADNWGYPLIRIWEERSTFLRVCGPLFGPQLENTEFFIIWFNPKNRTRMWPSELFLLLYNGWSHWDVCLLVEILYYWLSFFKLLTHITFCLFYRTSYRFLLKCATPLFISWFILVSTYNLAK
jgi:hypothetical protein